MTRTISMTIALAADGGHALGKDSLTVIARMSAAPIRTT